MNEPFEQTIDSDMSQFMALARDVNGWLGDIENADRAGYIVNLVVEEIASNVIRHGSDTEHPAKLTVRITQRENEIELVFEDNGKLFDPADAPKPATEAAIEDRKVGGLGLHLVEKMSRSMKYERTGGDEGRNRLTVCVGLESGSDDGVDASESDRASA